MEQKFNPDKYREVTKQYGEVTPVQFQLGCRALDQLTAFCLIDKSTIADQARRAIDEYIEQRLNDPNLPQLIDAARKTAGETS